MSATTTTPRYGETRVGYTMEPMDANGSYCHGGNHYANANNIEDARSFAERVIGSRAGGSFCGCRDIIASVAIIGKTWEWTGGGWRQAPGTPVTREIVTR